MSKRKNKAAASIVSQLREAIVASGLTHYRLGKDSGVSVQTIGRFVSGERDLRFESAGKLAAALGLELKPKS